MRLHEALDLVANLDELKGLTRHCLLQERNAYIEYRGPLKPMVQVSLHNAALHTAWTPTPADLIATDWMVCSTLSK